MVLEKFFIVIIVYVFGDKDTSNLSFLRIFEFEFKKAATSYTLLYK